MTKALLRGVSDAIASYGSDPDRAREQHAAYAAALAAAGVETIVLPADPALADCCFVEDTVVVDGGRALLTHMGSPARRPETIGVRAALEDLGFAITTMRPPATLDGGDVLRTGNGVYCGVSSRTNEAGAAALAAFLERPVTRVPVARCLHLKSACTAVGGDTCLLDPARVDPFPGPSFVLSARPNVLLVPGAVIYGLDISEFEKADGSLTCLSVLLS